MTVLLRSLLTALAISGPLMAQRAGKPESPDRFTEALLYSKFAREAFTCTGDDQGTAKNPAAEATQWSTQALAAIKRFKTTDPERRKRARAFQANEQRQRDTYAMWDRRLMGMVRDVRSAIVQGKLKTAERLLGEVPPCDSRFMALRRDSEDRRRIFRECMRKGIAAERSNWTEAHRQFEAAASIDREDEMARENLGAGYRL